MCAFACELWKRYVIELSSWYPPLKSSRFSLWNQNRYVLKCARIALLYYEDWEGKKGEFATRKGTIPCTGVVVSIQCELGVFPAKLYGEVGQTGFL